MVIRSAQNRWTPRLPVWSEEEFEEEEEAEDEDTDEDEDSPVGEQEEESSTKPADVARAALHASASKLVRRTRAEAPALQQRPPSPGFKRPPGADPNAIVVDFDGNSLARHLLEVFDFEPRPK